VGPAGNRGMVLSGPRSSGDWAMVLIDGDSKLVERSARRRLDDRDCKLKMLVDGRQASPLGNLSKDAGGRSSSVTPGQLIVALVNI
jgi:hypothetical protein